EDVVNGYPDGTVRPQNTINRAELVKVLVEGLYEGEGTFADNHSGTYKNCFPDVKEQWFAPHVCYALEKEWIEGYPDGNFRPEQNINKVEAQKIVINAFDITPSNSTSNTFDDLGVNEWYYPFIKISVEKNLLEENGNYFDPENQRTRGQVFEIMARVMQIQYMDDPIYTDQIRAEFATFQLLNRLREGNGVSSKLKLNPLLTKVAREHSQDMAENIGSLSHNSSDGTLSHDRIRESGVGLNTGTGENIGMGTFSDYRSIFEAIDDVHYNIFMIEPDGECNHRTTILSTCLPFTDVGIGVYVKDGVVYFTEDFIFFN
ncbi:S-layer homology domain-containing protein, partial [Patescibacteria group bacterium]